MTVRKEGKDAERGLRTLAVVVLAASLVFGCSGGDVGDEDASRDEMDRPPAVATVGDGLIRVADLESYLTDRPLPLGRPVTEEEIEKRLEELILEEVLYQEALRLEMDRDPRVRASIRRMLTQKLMEDEVNRKAWSQPVEEEELREYYERHEEEYSRPEEVRLAGIFIAVSSDASKEERAASRKRAESVLAEALSLRNQRFGFGELVEKHSDEPETYPKGDTGFFDLEGGAIGLHRNLTQAAFALERTGSIADHVIETPDGYHVVMLVGRRSAVRRELKDVSNELEQKIRRERVTRARKEYLEGLRQSTEIHVDEDAVVEVTEQVRKRVGNAASHSGREALRGSGSVEGPPPLPRGRN
jgi:parvulin-like peptidyl-prolyl isomerase